MGMTPARFLALWIVMLSGCATAPLPRHQREPPPLPPIRSEPERTHAAVRLASDTSAKAERNRADFIGKQELEQARATLNEAKAKLAPDKWARLDAKLTEAEQSYARFAAVAAVTGEVPLVARGASQVAKAGRAAELIDGAEMAAAPALVFLVLLWPSETADAEHDHGPDWLPPADDFKAKLRAVSQEAQQVQSELARQANAVPRVEPKAQPKVIPREAREGVPEWKRICRERYFQCVDEGWIGDCYACFRYCEGQHDWPRNRCYKPRSRR
jgi:hypothetical protein